MPRLAKDAKQQSSGKITRNPKCARCRNHGFIVQLKGHAGKCEFHHCACWKCSLITERTKIMAFQRRIKKSQAEEAEPGEPASAQAEDAPQVPPTASHGNGAGQVAQEARTPTAGAAAQGTGSDAQDPHCWASQRQSNKDGAFMNRTPRFPADYIFAELTPRDLYPGDLLTMPIPVKLYPYYGNPYACQTLLLNMAGAGADSVPGLPHFQSAGVPYSPEECRVPLFPPPLMAHVGVQQEQAVQHLPFTGLLKDREKRTGMHPHDTQTPDVNSMDSL
ncbi:uncharacterized protein [Paramormyrops kingsleyae]|uniref:uncharacterized protein n=1 Tax=Paramormyrops kingsleyae TaxID=1676925 RepID=UPI000CD5D6D1|nr:doublesex- and mab-3-related transcription factor 1-like [Paramormyrops kingsleyae]